MVIEIAGLHQERLSFIHEVQDNINYYGYQYTKDKHGDNREIKEKPFSFYEYTAWQLAQKWYVQSKNKKQS
jgi:hypothetical protein